MWFGTGATKWGWKAALGIKRGERVPDRRMEALLLQARWGGRPLGTFRDGKKPNSLDFWIQVPLSAVPKSPAARGKGSTRPRVMFPTEFLRPGLWGAGFSTLAQEHSVPRFAVHPL